ncbi:alpha/beta hydrolase [Parerythrobacter aurantius]|uniref:alpha/beta fold hydrolase n=1 Tax=Parerythrobacter aurantius TaxID=3127706 RepID=UPI0032463C3C
MKKLAKILGAIVALLLIAFLALRVPDTDGAAMRAKYGAPPSQFVKLANGITVHLRDEGPRDAPAIILLHGSNADLHTWQPWVDRLKDRYRVIRYDQRGHGLTGNVTGGYDADAFAADALAVADTLGLDKFVLAGNSMGGANAARFAMLHPDRLSGLVLVDAGGAPVKREGGGNLAFTVLRMPVIGSVASQMMQRPLVERSLRQSVANQSVVTPETIDRYWELARYPGNREATRERFSLPWTSFTAEQVRAITVPTLVMWGEEDSLIPFAAAGWFMQQLPDAKLVSYPGIGHIPMEEAPDRSAEDLRSWLEATLAAPSTTEAVD